MVTPVGTILCAGMLSLAAGILVTAALITACFDPPIDQAHSSIRPEPGRHFDHNNHRQVTTVA